MTTADQPSVLATEEGLTPAGKIIADIERELVAKERVAVAEIAECNTTCNDLLRVNAELRAELKTARRDGMMEAASICIEQEKRSINGTWKTACSMCASDIERAAAEKEGK